MVQELSFFLCTWVATMWPTLYKLSKISSGKSRSRKGLKPPATLECFKENVHAVIIANPFICLLAQEDQANLITQFTVCQHIVRRRIKPYLITVTSSSPVVSDMSGCKMTDLFTFQLLASWESWTFFWVKHLTVRILYGHLNCLCAPQVYVYDRKHTAMVWKGIKTTFSWCRICLSVQYSRLQGSVMSLFKFGVSVRSQIKVRLILLSEVRSDKMYF